MKRHYLPALRGLFGDWVYYSCLMPMCQVVERVKFANEIHKSEKLSDMIQRELKKGRSKEISAYLQREEQRFFNSLVVALYLGKPEWHGFENFRPLRGDIDIEDIPSNVENSVGFLSFTGEERIFAIDGQHRLAGMKEAITTSEELGDDEVPLILVAHRETEDGFIRTRRLFTTLNKTAKAVGKGEIIALDENDVMAIVTRYLIEEHELFGESRILFVQAPNLPANNVSELTTIGNIYDVLTTVFTKIKDKKKPYELKFIRPGDLELKKYTDFATNYFQKLADAFPPLREYFDSTDGVKVIRKYRHRDGGHLLFRPVGLQIITEVIGSLVSPTLTLDQVIDLVGRLPMEIEGKPYADVIWMTSSHNMNPKGRPLCRDLLLHMLGKRIKNLHERYAKQLGVEVDDCELPERLKPDIEGTQTYLF